MKKTTEKSKAEKPKVTKKKVAKKVSPKVDKMVETKEQECCCNFCPCTKVTTLVEKVKQFVENLISKVKKAL